MRNTIFTLLILGVIGCGQQAELVASGKEDATAKPMVTTASAVPVTIQVAYTNAPAYTNGQYYVWTSAPVATNALYALNNSWWFPITGHNAKTGLPAPDKAKTTKWADSVQVTTNNLYVVPRIPTRLMDALNVPEVEREAWWNAFQPSVEEYQDGWFPVEEE